MVIICLSLLENANEETDACPHDYIYFWRTLANNLYVSIVQQQSINTIKKEKYRAQELKYAKAYFGG